jgi:probable HAF family extracellular repeat protein
MKKRKLISLLLGAALLLVGSAAAEPAMTDLGTLGGNYAVAFGINECGQIVGYSETASGYAHAFLWDGGTMTDLGTLGGNLSHAHGINERGQVVGTSETVSGYDHAFLWTKWYPPRGTLAGTTFGGLPIVSPDAVRTIDRDRGIDKSRTKICDKASDSMLYYHKPEVSDIGNEATELGGGNIVIHSM